MQFVYSSMDLSLYLVEKFCGHEVALQCAKALLINMPRAKQSGYAVLPLSRPHEDTKVRAAEAYIELNYARDISIERLACELNMSPRNFIRRFNCRPCAWLWPKRCWRTVPDRCGP